MNLNKKRSPNPVKAIAPAMGCIDLVVRDMYAGLTAGGAGPDADAFRRAAILYHETKHNLCGRSADPVPVDEGTYFLLKKCVYHWTEGIRLALQCSGLDAESAHQAAAEGCRQGLYGGTEIRGEIASRYESVLSGPIREQYARLGEIPSNEWCAWLELEAAKTAALAMSL